jgi:hypothetical protein
MKLFVFFLFLTLSSLTSAQFVDKEVYDLNAPFIARSIDPWSKMGPVNYEFIYNEEVMKNVTFYLEYYQEGVLEEQQNLKLPIDESVADMEDLDLAAYYNFNNSTDDPLVQRSSAEEIIGEVKIKVDTIAYKPVNNEIIYYSDKDHLLGDPDDSEAALHALCFTNAGKITAKKTIDTFTKFIYDEAGNITETIGHRGIFKFMGVNEPELFFFSNDPTDYIKTEYDSKNRIKSQWKSIDERMILDISLESSYQYDCFHFLVHDEYQYNDDNQISLIKSTFYQLKKDWREIENTYKKSSITGTSHPNLDKLNTLLYSKNEVTATYTYGENGRVTQYVVKEINSKKTDDSFQKIWNHTSYEETIQYENDKVVEEHYFNDVDDQEGAILEQGFFKIIYHYDVKGTLYKKERYRKEKQEDDYQLVFIERLQFDYK